MQFSALDSVFVHRDSRSLAISPIFAYYYFVDAKLHSGVEKCENTRLKVNVLMQLSVQKWQHCTVRLLRFIWCFWLRTIGAVSDPWNNIARNKVQICVLNSSSLGNYSSRRRLLDAAIFSTPNRISKPRKIWRASFGDPVFRPMTCARRFSPRDTFNAVLFSAGCFRSNILQPVVLDEDKEYTQK